MSFREEIIGDARLILGDCREVLPTLTDVDAIVSDPPYGIGHKAHSNTVRNGWRGKKAYADATIHGDDADFDPDHLLGFRFVILWGANHFAKSLPRGRWLAWNKLGGLEPWDSFSDVEFAWQNERGADRIFSLLWKGLAQGEKTGGGERFHPTMKPVRLMAWCLGHVPSARIICDPYMGSGTTGVACAQLGRQFIGIEREPTYFDIACRRIEDAYKQPRLFDEPPPKPKQPGIFDGEAA
jgi:site-specific DNA-methyltransferase (adenine-specific)/modification methylase